MPVVTAATRKPLDQENGHRVSTSGKRVIDWIRTMRVADDDDAKIDSETTMWTS